MEKMDGRSLDILQENIEKMKELFPEVFTEKKIDFEKLQSVLGEYTETENERYDFTWNGKKDAIRISQTSTTGTLRPDKENSKNWDSTKNLYIEGDNLEVLKLLQKSYHSKVKMIYIDPPYNTGKDFVYKDNYRDNMKNYLEYTGQVDSEGKKTSTNAESSGRYHTDWLNMMYPRLRLARNLLTDDGVIFIAIDDNEVHNLRKICDEIFGEENFIEQLVWKRRATAPNDRIIGKNHEYIFAYAKSIEKNTLYLQPRSEKINDRYKNPDNDIRGRWVASDLSANGKGGRLVKSCIFPIINILTGEEHYPPKNKCWLYNKEKMDELIIEGRVGFRENSGKPFLKRYLTEVRQGATLPTIIEKGGFSFDSAKEIRELFNSDVFEFSKPTSLLKILLRTGSKDNDIVLDFFAGSSTTTHSIMDLNVEDNGNRKFIMVQLPEETDEKSEAFKAGYKTISDIGRERIRRAGEKIKEDNKDKEGIEDLDIGFKSFKLDSSNIKEWNPEYENEEFDFESLINNFVKDRSEEDILYEIMLKYGIDLTTPTEEHSVDGKTIYDIGFGSLYICLDKNIDEKIIEKIVALNKESGMERARVVFRDTGFKNDEIKLNAKLTLENNGVEEVLSI